MSLSDRFAYVYMVQCRDGSLYTGWTYDLEARVAKHNAGRGSRYTAGRRPVVLVYQEVWPDKNSALHREIAIKKLNRRQKLALVAEQATSVAKHLPSRLATDEICSQCP